MSHSQIPVHAVPPESSFMLGVTHKHAFLPSDEEIGPETAAATGTTEHPETRTRCVTSNTDWTKRTSVFVVEVGDTTPQIHLSTVVKRRLAP